MAAPGAGAANSAEAARVTVTVTLPEIHAAAATVRRSPWVRRTPLLRATETLCPAHPSRQPALGPGAAGGRWAGVGELLLKLETQQVGGSFKMRGVVAQLAALPPDVVGCVTMSAGNYGRSLTLAARARGLGVVVCMADTVPPERAQLLRGLGAEVVLVPAAELRSRVEATARERPNHVFLHPFDDPDLVRGHASVGLEILDEAPDADVVVVPCGGGGLLAGVATALALSGAKATVIGVEPEGAPKMARSLAEGHAVTLASIQTVAAGLAPPFAGQCTLEHIRAHAAGGVVLVSDDDICRAMRMLYGAGLVVEPSGAAGVAALLAGRVPLPVDRPAKVVCVLSGANVSPEQMTSLVARAAAAGW